MTPPADALDSGYRTALDATVHDLDDKAHTVAVDYPVALDTYQTDFGPSCFEEGWRRRLPVLCVNHNPDVVVGRAISAQSLPDRHRVVSRFADFDDVPAARAAFANIRDGNYPGFSFHYVKGVAVPHPSVRSAKRYTKATMIEHGPVLAPSIPGTQVVGLRSASAVVEGATLADLQLALDVAEQDLAEAKRLRSPGHGRLADLERAKRTSSALRAEIHAYVAPGAAGRRSQRSPAQLRLIAGALDRLNHRTPTGK